MSGLFASIQATAKALTAQSRGLETAGKNLANVNNPAYSRERVVLGDRGSIVTPQGVESMGVEALSIEQLRDTLLDGQVMRAISQSAAATAEQSGLQDAQAALSQDIERTSSAADNTQAGNKGVIGAVDDFFNAFSSFASNPTDIGERENLMQKAATLVDRLRLTDSRLATVQSDLDANIANGVTGANSLLSSIAALNRQIAESEIGNPGIALDLRDQRQAKIEELSKILPVELRNGTGGQINIVALDGSGNDVPLLTNSTLQGTVAFNGTAITAGTSATTLALASGSIKGALTARDVGVQEIRDSLDALTAQIVSSVNAAYNPTSISGGNFFVAAGSAASSVAITSTITSTNVRASNTSDAGDNTLALAVAALATHRFSTSGGDSIDGTYTSSFAQGVSRLGHELADANSTVDSQAGIEKLVRSKRDNVSGVSLDEEMADLMKFQRAFQASSRVFNIMDELLDNIVNQLGR